jgi:hypothetical protein
MSPRSLTSTDVQCPDRRTISRLMLIVLCLGLLAGPTVGAISGGQSAAAGPTVAAQQPPRSALQASAPNGSQPSTPTTPAGDPIGRIENLKIEYTVDTGSQVAPTMTVDAVKLNQSTVAIVYQHNQRTQRWYTTDKQIVSAVAWPNSDARLLKKQLAYDIRHSPVFYNEIRPFVNSPQSYPRTDTAAYKQEANETANKSILPNVPGPVEAAKDIYHAGINATSKGVGSFIDTFQWVVLTLPAPGEPTEPSTWFPGYASPLNAPPAPTADGTTAVTNASGAAGYRPLAGTGASGQPTTGNTTNATGNATNNSSQGIPREPPASYGGSSWWNAVWTMYGGLTALVVLPIFVSWVYGWSQTTSSREREAHLRQIAVAVGMIIGGLIVIPLALHLVNELATNLVPSGKEFMATPGSVSKFGLGLLVGGVVLVLESGLVVVALLVLFVEWVLVYLLLAVWPLVAVCFASGNRYLKPYGASAMVALGSILGLKLVQALWLRFLFELPLSFGKGGMSLLTIGATIVGLLIGFIYLPYYVVTNLLPTLVTSVGGGTGGRPRRSHQGYATPADGAAARGGERPARTTVASAARKSNGRTRPRPDGLGSDASLTATDGGPSQESATRSRDRARRVASIRQRAYRQDETFEQFPDDGSQRAPVARTRTTAESGSTGRTPDGAAGTVTETTETAVDTAEATAGKIGTAVGVAAEARRSAKAHWYGVKRYWRSALPGHRNRRPTKPVEPLRQKARRHAKFGWQGVKQRGRAGKDRLVERERQQRNEQRREHVRDQQAGAEETTTAADTDTATGDDSSVDDTTTSEQRRAADRTDRRKYGDVLSERQKSSIRRHAERRYRSRADTTENTATEDSETTEADSEASEESETDTDETDT